MQKIISSTLRIDKTQKQKNYNFGKSGGPLVDRQYQELAFSVLIPVGENGLLIVYSHSELHPA